jgi:hypothetical protein
MFKKIHTSLGQKKVFFQISGFRRPDEALGTAAAAESARRWLFAMFKVEFGRRGGKEVDGREIGGSEVVLCKRVVSFLGDS